MRRFALPAIAAAGLCLAAGAGFVKWRESRFFETSRLLSRFPVEDASVLRIDVAALRGGGLLSGSKAALEPEYKQFLDGTGFDYRRDLDLVLASFSKSGNFFIARGRFDWAKLRAYAVSHGGSCYQQLCRMQGSTPDRHISFLPLRSDAIAMAVSTDDLAASRLSNISQAVTVPLPSGPAWVSIPGSALRAPGVLPQGLRVVFSGLVNADRVVITVAPESAGIAAHLEASCRTQDDARILASQLRATTGKLKQALLTDPAAGRDELANMLVAGNFDQSGTRVSGRWPVGRTLLDSLTSGI